MADEVALLAVKENGALLPVNCAGDSVVQIEPLALEGEETFEQCFFGGESGD